MLFKKRKKEKSELSVEEKRKRASIILIAYLIFFSILIMILIFNKEENNGLKDAYETLDNAKNPIDVRFNNLVSNNNYRYEFYISSNLILKGEKEDEVDHGIKTYNNNETEYYINDNNYYLKSSNKFNKVETIDLFEEYDETLLTNDSLKKILSNAKITNRDKDGEKNIEEFIVNLNDVLKIYNEVNLTEFEQETEENLTGEVTYDENSIIIDVNMSPFYKVVYKNDILIQYNLKYYDFDKVNIDVNLKGDKNE